MTNVLSVINELRSNSGKNSKIEILSKYADNDLVKEVFDAAMKQCAATCFPCRLPAIIPTQAGRSLYFVEPLDRTFHT